MAGTPLRQVCAPSSRFFPVGITYPGPHAATIEMQGVGQGGKEGKGEGGVAGAGREGTGKILD